MCVEPEERFIDKDEVLAGCGMIVKKSEGFICPYYSRKEDWNKEHLGYGPCGVDIQVGTNVCMYAFDMNAEV